METSTRVLDLLDHWEEERAAGREIPLAVLCEDSPELITTVAEVIQLMHGLGQLACSAAPPGRIPPQGHVRYTFMDFLDAGGMGEVWAGFDTMLKRPVALKILIGGSLAPELRRRLCEEARLGTRLERPGVVPIYDIGDLPDGRPFLVMKLIRGKTLNNLLRGRPNPLHELDRWIAVFEKVCRIVGYAHLEQILHRDLKPSNVMVDEQGEVHVLDWGIAKLLEEEPSPSRTEQHRFQPTAEVGADTTVPTVTLPCLTQIGHVKGTPAFMSPEQAQGEVRQVTPRSDVFGLGGILCVVLTGQPPFVARSMTETLEMARNADLTDAWIRLEACRADPELIALARWCLQAAPADRPADAREVTRTLENYHHLGRLRDSLPAAGLVTNLVARYPYWATVLLALLPHAIGATLVTVYSLLWAAAYWPEALPVLSRIIVGYTLAALVVTSVLACVQTLPWLRVLGQIERREPITPERVTAARHQALRLQFWAFVFSAIGWLPGGFLVPFLLAQWLGNVDAGILAYFVLSFVVVGAIATTYCSLVVDFLILRTAYPRLWHLPQDLLASVRRELSRDPVRYRLLPQFATLIPLAATLVILTTGLLTDPGTVTSAASRLFQGLAILLVALGMLGSVLAGMLAHYQRRVVSGMFAALGVAIDLPRRA